MELVKRLAIIAVLISACGGKTIYEPTPPDAFQRDYFWAWSQYVGAWCDWLDKCLPDQFVTYFHDRATCVADNADSCDAQFGYGQCHAAYPDSKEPLLKQCVQEMAMLDCSAQIAPLSCGEAMTP